MSTMILNANSRVGWDEAQRNPGMYPRSTPDIEDAGIVIPAYME